MEENEVAKEVSDFVDDTPVVPDVPADTPADTPPVDETPADEPPVVPDTPATDLPPEVPKEPPVVPDEPPPIKLTREQELERDLVETRQQMEELAKKVVTPAEQFPRDEQGNVVSPPPQGPPIVQFIKDDADFDDALRSPENFNKLLTGVMYKAVESVMRTVPKLVTNLADQQITTRSAIQEFYAKNEDLIPSKAYVGMVADELVAKNPDWKLDKLMGELGKEVRTRLKLTAPGVTPDRGRSNTPPGQSPAFAGAGRGSGRTGALRNESPLQKDINDLISD